MEKDIYFTQFFSIFTTSLFFAKDRTLYYNNFKSTNIQLIIVSVYMLTDPYLIYVVGKSMN